MASPRLTTAAVATVLLVGTTTARPADGDEAREKARVARIAALGRLWGAVKFFHPWIASRDIDWDAAFVAAVPKVNAGASDAEYAATVASMLTALGDPATRVVGAAPPAQPSPEGERQPVATLRDDGVLVLTLSNYGDLLDFEAVRGRIGTIGPLFARARAFVFDLRAAAPIPDDARGLLEYVFRANTTSLSTTPLRGPAQRTRMHVGFAPETGSTSGGYYSGFSITDGPAFSPLPGAIDRPSAFLVNAWSELPPIALALQASGKAVIVAEGSASDASVVGTTRMELPGGVTVEMRLGELVYADGPDALRVDVVLPASTPHAGDDATLAAAIDLVKAAKLPVTARRPTAPSTRPGSERASEEDELPDAGHRVLAAVRIWATIRWFHPYTALIGEDWDAVLAEFIPRMEAAGDATAYALAVAEMASRTHDAHSFVHSGALSAYLGAAPAPVRVRRIDGLAVVTGFLDEAAAKPSGIVVGDVIVSVDGEPAGARFERLAKFVASSTPQGLDERVAGMLLNGPEGSTAKLVVRGADDGTRSVELVRRGAFAEAERTQRGGAVFELLPGDVGYADLDRLEVADVDAMFAAFEHAKAIVFDMRGYPRATAWAIAPRLTERTSVVAAKFECPVRLGPGLPVTDTTEESTRSTFFQELPSASGRRYLGPTVLLIDGRTMSQAEHTGLFLEAANGTKFIGSPTAGANGDVTNFSVPGGISIWFTGQAVMHADGRQLQRVGLQPDVAVRPTIAGIRAGRDEVLEKALEYVKSLPGK